MTFELLLLIIFLHVKKFSLIITFFLALAFSPVYPQSIQDSLNSIQFFIDGKTEEIKADAKELERLNNLIFRMIARNCGQKDDFFLKMVHEKGHADWFLTAKEARTHKLCTNIGIPELTIEVAVNYKFG